jgi:hypothetical protein
MNWRWWTQRPENGESRFFVKSFLPGGLTSFQGSATRDLDVNILRGHTQEICSHRTAFHRCTSRSTIALRVPTNPFLYQFVTHCTMIFFPWRKNSKRRASLISCRWYNTLRTPPTTPRCARSQTQVNFVSWTPVNQESNQPVLKRYRKVEHIYRARLQYLRYR